jgi:isoamylase
MRNLHLALMVSLGTPMILMGDEYGHTKNGNNNTYCHDDRRNWFLWDELAKEKEFFRFYALCIRFRNTQPLLHRVDFLTEKEVEWHGLYPFKPDWNPQSRFVAYTLLDILRHHHLYIAFNANYEPATIHLPPPPQDLKWYRIVDTALESPNDILEKPKDSPALSSTYKMSSYSAFIAQAF